MRSPARTDVPIPTPPFWGVKEIPVDLEEVYRHLDTHVLFKLHWGGRGVKGEAWQTLLRDDFRPRLERMWREQSYLHPRALLGFFPCYALGNDIIVLDPEDRETELTRFVCPRQPKGDRICLADFFRPAVGPDGAPSPTGQPPQELDVIAVQAVTVGSEVTELMAKLEAEGEFAEQLFVHGLGVQTAEGLAEWLHYETRKMLDIPLTQGRRYSWGYPAVPEQSTLALVAHHPQAIYFGTRQGRLLPDGSPDDLIRGSNRDPSLFGELDDEDPPDGAVEAEDEPALAGEASS